MSSHSQQLRSSQRLAAKSSKTSSSLCGTNANAKHRPPLRTQDAMLIDICDSSSDDGDSLQTPISESAHPIQIASLNASPAHEHGRGGRRATPPATHRLSPEKHHPKYFSDMNKNKCDNTSSATGFSYPTLALPSHASLHRGMHQAQPLPLQLSTQASLPFSTSASASVSSHSSRSGSSRSFASSTSSTEFLLSNLCSSSSLLDSSLSFEASAGSSSASDLSSSSADASFSSASPASLSILPGAFASSPMNPFSSSRYAPPPSSPLAQTFSAAQLEMRDAPVIDSDSPTPTQSQLYEATSFSQARKRLPDTQTPLPHSRPGQKPKLCRSVASEFLPSTLGRSYSNRFPADHRLRADFVREYILDGELGKGGYGFVMAASHRRDGYEVAVKFITKAKIPAPSWSVDDCGRPVPKEARLLSQLDHPGIVKFLDLFEDDVYFYLIQELHGSPWVRKRNAKFVNGPQSSIDQQAPTDENRPPTPGHPQFRQLLSPPQNALGLEGMDRLVVPTKFGSTSSGIPGPVRPSLAPRRASHDLFECIESTKNKRFSEEEAKYIFAQVVDVVMYLEKLGIAHSDIKDENVVINNELRIKLIDFGSALVHETAQPLPFHRRFYGTSAFASPEIVTNQPWQASPAEVWALGMLLSYLMRGTSPFPTDADKLAGRVVLDDKSRRRLSEGCVDLMRRCLRADPRERATIWQVRDDPWLRSGFERLRKEREMELEEREMELEEREMELEAAMAEEMMNDSEESL